MSTHTPNRWVMLSIENKKTSEVTRHILGGWSGGYLDGDSWRLSTPIVVTNETEDHYEFNTESGSSYICGKYSQSLTGLTGSVLSHYQKTSKDFDITIVEHV